MMNITTKVTETHYATCDICDNAGPEHVIMAIAVAAALEEGWEVTNRWNSLEHVSTTTCPRCSRTLYEAIHGKAGAEPQYQTDSAGEEETNGPQ